jgi:hypothetical protein
MNKTKDCYIKNVSGGMVKVGRNANNKPIVTLPLNACAIISSDLLEDADVKRAFNLGLLSMISEDEVMKYENQQRDKASQFVPSKFDNPLSKMTIREAISHIREIESIEELENLITLEERDSVADEIEKRIDELEDKSDVYEVD